MAEDCIFLDYETRATVDLEEVGTDVYARQAVPLMLGWARGNRKPQLWFPSTTMPAELHEALLNPEVLKVAWYSVFERSVTKYSLGIDIPIEQWRDPRVVLRYLSLPGSLDEVCDILKINKDQAKIKHGKALIKIFCEYNPKLDGAPTLYGKSNGFGDPREHEVEWSMFQNYCLRDIEVERLLWNKTLKLDFPPEQWEDWFLDQEMNEFGIPVNVERAAKALRLAQRCKDEFQKKLNDLTGLENANSRTQLLPWLQSHGYGLGSIEKKYVETELKSPDSKLDTQAREVLNLRQKSSQNSYKKIEQMLLKVSPDGRLRNQFVYFGAPRTGRWSSHGIQVQNFPRPIKAVSTMLEKDPDKLFDLIDNERYDEITRESGSTLPFVGSILRTLFEVAN